MVPGSRGPDAGATSLLVLEGITKRFGPTLALDDVTVGFATGEVHALVGENGAGKTTLLNIVAGVIRPDPPSTMLVDGVHVDWARHSPRAAQALGISIVPQDFALIESMTVAENVLLGRELRRGPLLRRHDMDAKVEGLLRRLGANFSADTPVERLGVAQAQLIEIAKALAIESRIVAMDEPSAVLAGDELERLFRVVRQLADNGVAVIYVSHRLDEVFAHCQRFSVMKDGRLVESGSVGDVDRDRLVRRMVGREVSDAFPDRRAGTGSTVLRVEELSVDGKLHDIDLEVRAGEIVGVAGLMGSGRTTLAKAIFGAIPVSEGTTVEVGESRGPFHDPRAALAAGVAYLPEDRKREGLATRKSVKMNTTLLGLDRASRGVPRLIRPGAEREMVGEAISRFSIRASPEGRDLVMRLSGGNQQKVVLAKWLEADPKVSSWTNRHVASTSARNRRSIGSCATSRTRGSGLSSSRRS
jgi:ABC-type sugar transport system ATPase subunit